MGLGYIQDIHNIITLYCNIDLIVSFSLESVIMFDMSHIKVLKTQFILVNSKSVGLSIKHEDYEKSGPIDISLKTNQLSLCCVISVFLSWKTSLTIFCLFRPIYETSLTLLERMIITLYHANCNTKNQYILTDIIFELINFLSTNTKTPPLTIYHVTSHSIFNYKIYGNIYRDAGNGQFRDSNLNLNNNRFHHKHCHVLFC